MAYRVSFYAPRPRTLVAIFTASMKDRASSNQMS